MPSPRLILPLLLAAAFALAASVGPKLEASADKEESGLLVLLMGDGRRLFANYFFAQADTYFHSGAYPSIFDAPAAAGEKQAEEEGHDHDHDHAGHEEEEHGEAHAAKYEGQALDWLDRLGRNFYASEHTHLDEGGARGQGGGDEVSPQIREILPWLKLASEMDPNRVESYTVAAFWLRRMKKSQEAEEFLRDGWRQNPDSCAILFELGRIYDEDRKDAFRARNVWEAALGKWQEQESGKENPDTSIYAQLLGHLARLEGQAGHAETAVRYLELLRAISPNPAEIQKRIDEVKSGKTKW